jgi:type I restriction enzyme S subunit
MSWNKVKLGEICRIEKGATGILKAIPGEYPMVVTGEERKSHNEYQFDEEAVIIPLVSGTGHGHASIKRIHFQSGKFALGSILCAVIPKDKKKLSAEYLYRFLDLNKENELVARMKGMANVTLPMKEIAQIEIPLPSLKEQFKFVESYKALESNSEELASELSHQLTIVKKLRQQLLQDAVQGKLVSQDKNAEPASELLKKIKVEKVKDKKYKELPAIKSEEIPFEIPDNWTWCKLGDIAIDVSTGPFGTMLHKSDYVQNQIPLVNPMNIVNEKIVPSHKMTVDQTTIKRLKNYVLNAGDIVISRRGEMGRCAAVTENEKGWLCGTGSFFIRLYPSINREYFVKVIGSTYSKNYLLGSSVGSTMNNLNHKILNSLLIPVPPIAVQQGIVSKLKELVQICDELDASIQASKGQNEQLLQQVLREALKG